MRYEHLTPKQQIRTDKMNVEEQLEAIQEECADSIIREDGIYVECFISNECLQPLLDALLMTDKLMSDKYR